jgi:hypothetical protein
MSEPFTISEPPAARTYFSLVDSASRMADYLYPTELENAFELAVDAVGECGYLEFLCHLEGHIIFPVVVAQVWAACEPDCPDGERQIRIASEFRKLWDRYRAYLEDPATLLGEPATLFQLPAPSSNDPRPFQAEDCQPQAD